MTNEERHCLEVIELLQQEYHKAVKPYLERLAHIRSLQRPATFIMPPLGALKEIK